MIGQTLSHYRIEAELGRGGMGVVYRAYDERLRRPVALKLLADEIAGHGERRTRLLAEARAASPLNHPGIATIYQVGEDGDHLFIVMELVEGQTLKEVKAEGPLEPRVLARLGAQVAEALAAAHAQGVIHGDIKPENIVVLPEGGVKLLDFGIARRLAEETVTVTRTERSGSWLSDSVLAGTLAYMAPEQLRGEAIDTRADLFSVGVVLYELAAGQRPFPGPIATALIAQILNNPPSPLTEAKALVPAELARLVHKLLEKDRGSRYQSAREVQVDLNNLVRELELGAALHSATAGKRTVAVLPFKLLTPNPSDEYLSVALADAVINHLSTHGELLVRPTSTIQRYVRETVVPLTAARELNVEVVVDGSIQKVGDQLRVHVQAWDARDASALLSRKHESRMANLFALQDEVAQELGRALGSGSPPAPAATAAPPTENATAYELFLRANERFTRLNRWDLHTAIEILEETTRMDPQFADAWARLAGACIQMGMHFDTSPRWIRKAERAVRRALALDPKNAEAYCARAKVVWSPTKGFQHRTALRLLTRALEINPALYEAIRFRSSILYHVGLHEAAYQELLKALAASPDDVWVLRSAGHIHFYIGRYEEAEEYYQRVLTLDSADLLANLFRPLVPLYQNDLEEAEMAWQTARSVMPNDPLTLSAEALLWAKRGETRKAEQAVQRTLRAKQSLGHYHHSLHTLAAALAVLGKAARAVSLLRKAADIGLPNYPLFRDDPHFQSLRNRPQYVHLLSDLQRQWKSYRREFGQAN
jgi:serine/threonine protein kinase/Tfp pilus assembly protein PilF